MSKTELGLSKPNNSLKNTALFHSILLGSTPYILPKISEEYSEENFIYKTNSNTCFNNKTDYRYLLYESPSGVILHIVIKAILKIEKIF